MALPENEPSHNAASPSEAPSVEPAKSKRILLVCRANQARSPLAATLLNHHLGDLGAPDDYAVSSAGTDASEASMVIPQMRSAAAELGIDLSSHRASLLNRNDIATNDLILTMTESQRGAISRLTPQSLDKTFTLREFVRLSEALAAGTEHRDLKEMALALHRGRALVPAADGPEDVRDPDGLDKGAAAEIAAEIDRLVRVVATLLAGVARSTR